jgi:hypothetical protein
VKKLLLASIFVVLASCGGTEVIYVTATTETETTTTLPGVSTTVRVTPPLSSRPPSNAPGKQPGLYDPEQYDTFLWSNVNEFWWLFTREQLLQMGLLVCEEFDRGATLDQVTASLVRIMTNTNTEYLAEGLAGVTAGALMFLCSEHSWWLETI